LLIGLSLARNERVVGFVHDDSRPLARCLLLFRYIEKLGVMMGVLCRKYSAFVVNVLFDVVSPYHLSITEDPATRCLRLLCELRQGFFALLAVACNNDSLVFRCPLAQLFWPRDISRNRRSQH